MHICDPKDSNVLILSHFWTPINITTAKEGIRKLMSPNVRAISKGGEPLAWKDWINSGRASYYENQPFLRSVKGIFPVPTILLTSSSWSYRCHKQPSINYLYKRFDGICQICGNKFPIKKMSIEHIVPKSFGGADEWMNLTMTCKTCNCKKGTSHPYKDFKGMNLSAPKPYPFFHIFCERREEWGIFLFKK